jgi:hypothetical protein
MRKKTSERGVTGFVGIPNSGICVASNFKSVKMKTKGILIASPVGSPRLQAKNDFFYLDRSLEENARHSEAAGIDDGHLEFGNADGCNLCYV